MRYPSIGTMAYLVETDPEEHKAVLRNTLEDWSRLEHDVYLVGSDGLGLFSHKVLLSFHSLLLGKILKSSTQKLPSISLPASGSVISSLITMMISGKVTTSSRQSLDEVKDLGSLLGMDLGKSSVDGERITNPSVSIRKLPVALTNMVQSSPEAFELEQNQQQKDRTIEQTQVYKAVQLDEETPNVSKIFCDYPECNKPFAKRERLREHRYRVHKRRRSMIGTQEVVNRPFEVENTAVAGENFLLEKMEPDVEAKDKCPLADCGKLHATRNGLRIHMNRYHGLSLKEVEKETREMLLTEAEEVERIKHKCPVANCDKYPETRKALRSHLYKYHAMNITDFNEEDLRRVVDLIDKDWIRESRNLTCNICNKLQKSRKVLKVHKRIHLPDSEKPFQCEECGKRFCQNSQKTVHMKRHHNSQA